METNQGMLDTKSVEIWNVKLNLLTKEEIVSLLNNWLASGRKGLYFTPADANVIMMAQEDKNLRDAILVSDITNVDSYLPAKYLKQAGYPIEGRVATPDVMDMILENAVKMNQSVYFLGATDSTLEKLEGVVKEKYPNLKIAGMHNGYFSSEENKAIADEISVVHPDIVFVGMPTPKKEVFVLGCKNSINAGVLYCVGGAFDALAGVLPRPPKWLRFGPMEGVFRILRKPRVYWRRALQCFAFMSFASKWNKKHKLM